MKRDAQGNQVNVVVSRSSASRAASMMIIQRSIVWRLGERSSIQGWAWARAVMTIALGTCGCRRLCLAGGRIVETGRLLLLQQLRGGCRRDQKSWFRIGMVLGTMSGQRKNGAPGEGSGRARLPCGETVERREVGCGRLATQRATAENGSG